MDPEDELSSDNDDEDYCPAEPTEVLSEIDSDDEVDEPSCPTKATKRKQSAGKVRRSSKIPKLDTSEENKKDDDVKELDLSASLPENEKARADALWDDFLKETKTVPKPAAPVEKKDIPAKSIAAVATPKTTPAPKTEEITKIFEYAGEKVVVTETKPVVPSSKKPLTFPPASKSGGGLGSILNQLGKKNKISTLEKTKLDWNSFKQSEGIQEELQTHNKGKDGFLERRDFLERTDVRQFEIEKSLRQSRRSNR